MQIKHIFLIILIMFFFGSVYPLGKLGTNNIPPILFSALRVFIIFIGIIPFFRFRLPKKKLILPYLDVDIKYYVDGHKRTANSAACLIGASGDGIGENCACPDEQSEIERTC